MNPYLIPGIRRATNKIDRICEMTCDYFGYTWAELVAKSRKADLVVAREVCYYLLRTLGDMTLEAIGKLFERHHSTIVHGLDMIRGELDVSMDRKHSVQTLTNRINGTWHIK